jgi:hypothetical protein
MQRSLISRRARENFCLDKFRVDLCRQVCYHVAHERDNKVVIVQSANIVNPEVLGMYQY